MKTWVFVKESCVESLLLHGSDHLLGPLLELQVGVVDLRFDDLMDVLKGSQ